MTKEEIDVQKEIEEHFTESAGFGRDKIQNFMDIVNKALKQKGGRIEELEQENAKLKEANQTLATMNESMWVELEKKRAESQGITNKLHQLIKAKSIIKKFSEFVNNEAEYDSEHSQEHTDKWNKLCEQAEQFLSEVNEDE